MMTGHHHWDTTRAFLRMALSNTGWLVIAGMKMREPESRLIQRFVLSSNIDEAIGETRRFYNSENDVFWATSTYSAKHRTKAGAMHVKVLKLDIDVDDSGVTSLKPGSKEEALRELEEFIKGSGMPRPAVVDSGGGLHVYWLLEQTIEAARAEQLGRLLKSACHHFALRCDHAVTADTARLLRVPGTLNYKYTPPRLVHLRQGYDTLAEVDVDYIESCLKAFATKTDTTHLRDADQVAMPFSRPDYLRSESDELTYQLAFGKRSFAELLRSSLQGTGCEQIARAYWDKATLPYPAWRAALSIAGHCTDCETAIRDISCGHPRYDPAQTRQVATQISGPYFCSTFENDVNAELCAGCQHKGRITSPIALASLEIASAATSQHPVKQQNSFDGDRAPDIDGLSEDDESVRLLASLSPLEYDRQRKKAAKKMGVRESTLDELVKFKRHSDGVNKAAKSTFETVAASDHPVNVGRLLDEINAEVRKYIVCDDHTAAASALWITMTWFMDVVQVAPLAVITAPEKRCGKSQLLAIIGRLAYRPLASSNITAPALFRAIEKWQPTLLIDEADSFVRDNEELRGVLNAGHTRDSAFVLRTVGEDFEPKRFSVWGAKALAGIGKLADTLMDRAIILELRRRLPHETVEKLRRTDDKVFAELRSKLARVATDYVLQVAQARPAAVQALHDRAQDNWEPLLAIADVAGGIWPEIAREAAAALSGQEDGDAPAAGTLLLEGIRNVFKLIGNDRISTDHLLTELCSDEEAPWPTYNRGRPMSARQLAMKLKGYGITSATIRFGKTTAKGYMHAWFKDAFSRYLPGNDQDGSEAKMLCQQVVQHAQRPSAWDQVVRETVDVEGLDWPERHLPSGELP